MNWCEIDHIEVVDNEVVNRPIGYISAEHCMQFMALYPDTLTEYQNTNAEALADGSLDIKDKIIADGGYYVVGQVTYILPTGLKLIEDLENLE